MAHRCCSHPGMLSFIKVPHHLCAVPFIVFQTALLYRALNENSIKVYPSSFSMTFKKAENYTSLKFQMSPQVINSETNTVSSYGDESNVESLSITYCCLSAVQELRRALLHQGMNPNNTCEGAPSDTKTLQG